MKKQQHFLTGNNAGVYLKIIFGLLIIIVLPILDKALPVRASYVPEVTSAYISGTYSHNSEIYFNSNAVLYATVEDYDSTSMDISVYATVYRNGEYFKTLYLDQINDLKYSAELDFFDEGNYTFELYVKDVFFIRCDNDFCLDGGTNGYIADNSGPDIRFDLGRTYFDGTDYYVNASASINGVSVNMSVSDNTGIRNLSVSVNERSIGSDYYGRGLRSSFGDGTYEYGPVSINTIQIQDYLDSLSENSYSYEVYARSEDRLSNSTVKTANILMDVTSPAVTNINVDGIDIIGDFDTYVFECNSENCTIKVGTTDATSGGVGFESGVAGIHVRFIGADGGVTEKTYIAGGNEISVTTPGTEFKGRLEIYAFDNVGNIGDTVGTKGIVCEPQSCHDRDTHIFVTMPDTPYKTVSGNLLYNSNTSVKVTVIDEYSGIRSISVSSSTLTLCDDEYYETYSDLQAEDTGVFHRRESDKGLATKAEGNLNVKMDCNDITLYITIKDNAGNTSVQEVTFSIDKSRPEITSELLNTSEDETFSDYYKSDQYVKITVKDRNFDDDKVYFSEKENQTATVLSGFTCVGTDEYGVSTYEITVPYTKDGEYEISVSSNDLAENAGVRNNLEHFVVDKTAPSLTVTYNSPAGIGDFYREERTLSLTVSDTNFTSYRVECVRNTNCRYFSGFSEWTENVYTNSSAITFDETGTYDFTIKVTDKAGNVTEFVVPTFVIDFDNPVIGFYGAVDGGIYQRDVEPNIRISDAYYDADTLEVSLTGVRTGFEGTIVTSEADNTGEELTMTTISAGGDDTSNYDDVYTLSVASTDKAGNETESVIYFSVNCNGSVYDISDATGDINYSYISGENGVTVTEINPDVIKSNDIEIVLYKDGVPTILTRSTDYVINKSEIAGEYKRYSYLIKPECFSEDGVYEVSICSVDRAGNVNENLDADRGGLIRFAVDNTAPMVSVINTSSDTRYEEPERTVEFSVFDKYGDAAVTVYVDDVETPVAYNPEKDVYEFILQEDTKARNIVIMAVDYAGNVTEIHLDNIKVLQEWYVRFMNNKPLRNCSFAGLIVLIIVSIRLYLQIKRKRIYFRNK